VATLLAHGGTCQQHPMLTYAVDDGEQPDGAWWCLSRSEAADGGAAAAGAPDGAAAAGGVRRCGRQQDPARGPWLPLRTYAIR